MAYCSRCGAELPAGASKCDSCGAIIGGSVVEKIVDPYDHSAEFDATDISDNKVYALLAYGLDFFGLLLALIVAKDSPYVKFHAREAAKLTIAFYIVAILMSVLCWTCIVPILGCILVVILLVLKIIAFIQVCQNKAKEPWLIRSLGFLK